MQYVLLLFFFFFFFNDTATTEIYTLSLHDALPISRVVAPPDRARAPAIAAVRRDHPGEHRIRRSEEHTSELQSRLHLVCRLLLEKKKHTIKKLRVITLTPSHTPQSRSHHSSGARVT